MSGGEASVRRVASLSRCDAHVSPPCAHLSQLGDALPVAIVGDVVAKHEREANQVGEDRVRVRVREDVVEKVLGERLFDDERERHAHQGRHHRPRDGGASHLVK